jgi:hypothetical protein
MQSVETKRTWWGIDFQNLAERVALELFELFDSRPRLQRCRLCNRIFVPRTTADTKCRADLWELGQTTALELCNPQYPVDAYYARILAERHGRERKSRHQQMRRELKRFGEGSPRAERAKAKYEDWILEHGKQRGPAPRPMPDLIRHGNGTTASLDS